MKKNFFYSIYLNFLDHGLFRAEPAVRENPVADAIEPILRVEIAPPNSQQSMRGLADRIGK